MSPRDTFSVILADPRPSSAHRWGVGGDFREGEEGVRSTLCGAPCHWSARLLRVPFQVTTSSSQYCTCLFLPNGGENDHQEGDGDRNQGHSHLGVLLCDVNEPTDTGAQGGVKQRASTHSTAGGTMLCGDGRRGEGVSSPSCKHHDQHQHEHQTLTDLAVWMSVRA